MSRPGHQLQWIKASHSYANGECIELALLADGNIGLRDSKNPEGDMLRFSRGELDAFIKGASAGEFDHLR